MRYKFIICFFGISISLNGFTQQPVGRPAAYSDPRLNFVRTWDATAPEPDPNTIMDRAGTAVIQSTQYFDGLGRPIQTVIKKGSFNTATGDQRDLINATVYDAFGQEVYKYLPFVSTATGGSEANGLFKSDPFQQQKSFYNMQLAGQPGETNVGPESSNWAYGQTVFESSPLNRPLESFAPGSSWVGTSGESAEADRRSIKTKYWFNTLIDSVRIWNVTNVANSFGTYATPSGAAGIYPAGQLSKTIVVDEHGKQVIEFRDKQDRTILKKVQFTAVADTGAGKGHTGWLCTYYIYDDKVNLRCVVQPAGVAYIAANSWAIGNLTILNEQCFRYEYDHKGRMIFKKVPGAGRVLMIYDARDRLVMTQDSLMRTSAQKKWLYTTYDVFNRPVSTGLITDNSNYNNAAYHRLRADTSLSYPNTASYPNEELTRTFYDNYNWRSSEGNPLSASLDNSQNGYLLTVSDVNWPFPQAVAQSNELLGLVTGTKTKILNTATYLYTVNFYDGKKRLIQVQSKNAGGGTDVATTQYSWHGQPLLAILKQEKSGPNAQTITSLKKMTYDSLWRVSRLDKKISHSQVNGGAMPSYWTTIVENEYDALGQLVRRNFAPGFNSGAGLESLDYAYNLRGWMLGANRAYAKDSTSDDHYFGFDLGYDKTGIDIITTSQSYTAAQYNGNIGGMLWKSTGDDQLRKYDFSYDAVNRLTNADFNQFTNSGFNKSAGVDFSVKNLTYDVNGNILTMNQRGWKLGGSQTIDSLLYTYTTVTNKLKNVLDRKNDTATRLGDFRSSKDYMTSLGNNKTTSATDYTYDVAGNLKTDKNKDITIIRYNYLNLPDSIVIASKGTIKYQYDAAGNKIKKTVVEGSRTTTTLYLGGAVFRNDTLEFIAHEEGRIRKCEADTLVYDYMLKDHLANVRMVLTTESLTQVYPAATMEDALAATEDSVYANLSETRTTSLPSGYPANTPPGNAKVAKVGASGGTQKIGPSITLKVMAGDKFNVTVNSWWKSTNTPTTPTNPLTDLVALLNSSVGSIAAGHSGVTETTLQSSNVFSPSVTNFLNSQSYTSSRPKAYLNWILFDEQFNFVANSSGFEQVGSSNVYTAHTRANLTIGKSGYLYIYVSNVTDNIDVFFDNLQVTHIRGPILEESHYYPFGLTMAGISSRALNAIIENKFKFTNQLLDDDLGLNLYQMRFRNHDPQIGRFIQTDPLADHYVYNSTYTYAENDVIRAIDVEGLEKLVIINEKVNRAVYKVTTQTVDRHGDFLNNNITINDPPEYNNLKIEKDVLRIQNGSKINGVTTEISQDDSKKDFEGFIMKNGVVEHSVVGEGNGSVHIDDIVNTGKNTIIGVGQDFNEVGDRYVKSVGYFSGLDHTTRNEIHGTSVVTSQIKDLSAAVKNLDMENIMINLTGNKADLKKLNNMKEMLQKTGYASATINVHTYKKDKKYNDKGFHFNATVSAVKE